MADGEQVASVFFWSLHGYLSPFTMCYTHTNPHAGETKRTRSCSKLVNIVSMLLTLQSFSVQRTLRVHSRDASSDNPADICTSEKQ